MFYRNTLKSLALSGSALCLAAGLAQADQVILDDLIVDGSICAGLDCVNGESFGFDTLRLKENNLRIRAFDTSASASFPSNDWQITFNESSNGGANKFSIDDIDGGRTPFTIEAGAPSHSLYVDDGGRIGLGTATPVVELHIPDGDTPTLRLEQDGTSGFSPQTWDLAGNETNFFIRDVSNGSTLPFRVRPGAPTSAIDIAANGDIGLGTSSPSSELHLNSTAADSLQFTMQNTNASINREWQMVVRAADGEFAINDNGVAGAEFIFAGPNAATPGLNMNGTLDASDDVIAGNNVICNGTANACLLQTSDLRLKPDATTIANAADVVRELRPIRWTDNGAGVSTGFGAQEVAAVMEKHGFEGWTGHQYNTSEDKHLISYTALISLLVGAHHEKDVRIQELETAVKALSEQL